MSQQWYYGIAGQQLGPVAEANIGALIDEGKIAGTTPVWTSGMLQWQRLDTTSPWKDNRQLAALRGSQSSPASPQRFALHLIVLAACCMPLLAWPIMRDKLLISTVRNTKLSAFGDAITETLQRAAMQDPELNAWISTYTGDIVRMYQQIYKQDANLDELFAKFAKGSVKWSVHSLDPRETKYAKTHRSVMAAFQLQDSKPVEITFLVENSGGAVMTSDASFGDEKTSTPEALATLILTDVRKHKIEKDEAKENARNPEHEIGLTPYKEYKLMNYLYAARDVASYEDVVRLQRGEIGQGPYPTIGQYVEADKAVSLSPESTITFLDADPDAAHPELCQISVEGHDGSYLIRKRWLEDAVQRQ